MTATEQFHAHLDACRRCREHPMDLCATGQHLLEHAATDSAGTNGLDLTWADVARAAEQLKVVPQVLGTPRFCGLAEGPGSYSMRQRLDPDGQCEGALGWVSIGLGCPPMGLCARHGPLVAQAMGK